MRNVGKHVNMTGTAASAPVVEGRVMKIIFGSLLKVNAKKSVRFAGKSKMTLQAINGTDVNVPFAEWFVIANISGMVVSAPFAVSLVIMNIFGETGDKLKKVLVIIMRDILLITYENVLYVAQQKQNYTIGIIVNARCAVLLINLVRTTGNLWMANVRKNVRFAEKFAKNSTIGSQYQTGARENALCAERLWKILPLINGNGFLIHAQW